MRLMSGFDWKAIGDRVREAREALGLSEEDLARLADFTVEVIQSIEAGRYRIDAYTLAQLSRALNVPVGNILHPWPPAIDLARHRRHK